MKSPKNGKCRIVKAATKPAEPTATAIPAKPSVALTNSQQLTARVNPIFLRAWELLAERGNDISTVAAKREFLNYFCGHNQITERNLDSFVDRYPGSLRQYILAFW